MSTVTLTALAKSLGSVAPSGIPMLSTGMLAAVILLFFTGTHPIQAQTQVQEEGLCTLIRSSVAQAELQPPQKLTPTTGPGAFSTLLRWCSLGLADATPDGKGVSYVLVKEFSNDNDAKGDIGNEIKQYGALEGLGNIAVLQNVNGVRTFYFSRNCFEVWVQARRDWDSGVTSSADVENARRLAGILDNNISRIPTCSKEDENDRLPVIFIPGVAGTILQDSVGNELWPLAPVANRANLALESDGVASARNTSVAAGDILRRTGMNFYGGFMTSLEEIGYKEGVDLFAFPYDWRYSNDSHFARLDKLIDDILEKTKKKKVILTAHSMGGVISRAYIYSSPQRAQKVKFLITMGTPYWGAPKVFYGITSGYQFGNPTVRQELMKVLLQNMPAAYQLLPQAPFITDKKSGQMVPLEMANAVKYRWFTKHTLDLLRDSYEETPGNELSFNAGLMKKSNEFYANVGTRDQPRPLPAGIKQYAVIGTGVNTVTSFEMEDFVPGILPEWLARSKYVEIGGRHVILHPIVSDGDGTVPLWSLETAASTANYYVPNTRSASAAHGELPGNPTVQSIVKAIIKGKPPSTNEYPRPQYWMGRPITPGTEVEDTTQFELHSDAHLRLMSTGGGSLGFNTAGGIDEELPGTFMAYEGAEFAAVPSQAGPLRVMIDGIRDGKFTLIVRQRSGGAPAGEFMYKEVPVTATTKTEFSFIPFADPQPPSLQIREGGSTRRVDAIAVQPLKVGTAAGGQISQGLTGTIPSVGGTVTSFKFFTFKGEDIPPSGTRSFQDSFSTSELGGVYFEFAVKYDADSAVSFPLTVIWRRGVEEFERQELNVSKPAGYSTSTKTYGYIPANGKWQPGTYTVDVLVRGRTIVTGHFLVN